MWTEGIWGMITFALNFSLRRDISGDPGAQEGMMWTLFLWIG